MVRFNSLVSFFLEIGVFVLYFFIDVCVFKIFRVFVIVFFFLDKCGMIIEKLEVY